VTMRLLAEKVLEVAPRPLPPGGGPVAEAPSKGKGKKAIEWTGKTYVQGELGMTETKLHEPAPGGFHVYCSPNNAGALEVMKEFAMVRGFSVKGSRPAKAAAKEQPARSRLGFRKSTADAQAEAPTNEMPPSVMEVPPQEVEGAKVFGTEVADAIIEPTAPRKGRKGSKYAPPTLYVSASMSSLPQCEHFLVYLNSRTWTSGNKSASFAQEVERAKASNVHLLLVHEMPGIGGQAERGGCDFGTFFACDRGATPQNLLTKGIYNEIAVPLKGGPWRETSMAMLAQAITSTSGETMSEMLARSSTGAMLKQQGLLSIWGASHSVRQSFAGAWDSGRRSTQSSRKVDGSHKDLTEAIPQGNASVEAPSMRSANVVELEEGSVTHAEVDVQLRVDSSPSTSAPTASSTTAGEARERARQANDRLSLGGERKARGSSSKISVLSFQPPPRGKLPVKPGLERTVSRDWQV